MLSYSTALFYDAFEVCPKRLPKKNKKDIRNERPATTYYLPQKKSKDNSGKVNWHSNLANPFSYIGEMGNGVYTRRILVNWLQKAYSGDEVSRVYRCSVAAVDLESSASLQTSCDGSGPKQRWPQTIHQNDMLDHVPICPPLSLLPLWPSQMQFYMPSMELRIFRHHFI